MKAIRIMCIDITSKSGKKYKRTVEEVIYPICNTFYIRAHNKYHAPTKKCRKCSLLENNKNKKFNGCSTIGDLTGSFYNNLKSKCKSRNKNRNNNIEFLVSKEFLWNLFLEQNKKCAISGLDLDLLTFNRRSLSGKSVHPDTSVVSASLDRIDSSQGYTEDNVQWVHKVVNIMKNTLSDNDLIFICKKIAINNNSKENTEPSFINGIKNNIIMKKVQRLTVDGNQPNNTDTRIQVPENGI